MKVQNLNIDDIGEIIKDIVDNVLMERFHFASELKFWYKSGSEIVTEADIAAGRALETALTKVIPGSSCLNEETTTSAYTAQVLGPESGAVWVIDPLDGTSQFVQRKNDWGTIVTLVLGGVVATAWIFIPCRDFLFSAERGSGCQLNGSPVRLRSPAGTAPKGAVLALGDFDIRDRMEVEKACRDYPLIRGTLSCAVDYAELCLGHQDIAVFGRTRPWDHAAGVFLHREAGGAHLCFGYKQYALSNWHAGLLLGPDQRTIDALAQVISVFRPPS